MNTFLEFSEFYHRQTKEEDNLMKIEEKDEAYNIRMGNNIINHIEPLMILKKPNIIEPDSKKQSLRPKSYKTYSMEYKLKILDEVIIFYI